VIQHVKDARDRYGVTAPLLAIRALFDGQISFAEMFSADDLPRTGDNRKDAGLID
jgi:hypothetical protein